jgi:hypothetical protein
MSTAINLTKSLFSGLSIRQIALLRAMRGGGRFTPTELHAAVTIIGAPRNITRQGVDYELRKMEELGLCGRKDGACSLSKCGKNFFDKLTVPSDNPDHGQETENGRSERQASKKQQG